MENNTTYYHFCLKDNLLDIFAAGLKVDSGKVGFVRHAKELERYKKFFGCQPIFLTIDPQHVIDTMLGNTVERYTKLKISGLSNHRIVDERLGYRQIFDRFPESYKEPAKTFVCFDNIGPQHIEVML